MSKIFYIIILIFFSSCSQFEACEDTKCIDQKLKNHKIKQISYWDHYFTKPVSERIFVANEDIINFIELDNKKNGYPNKPFIPNIDQEFIQDIKDAIIELPEPVKKLISKKLAGIFLLNDLGSTGFSDAIKNKNNENEAAFIFLDYQVLLKRKANEWATWKETTPFKTNPQYSIEAKIESEKTNTRKYAIQYILLHELGHVITINDFFHPYWGIPPKDIKQLHKYDFYNMSWKVTGNKHTSLFDDILDRREEIVYYWGARLKIEDSEALYTKLEKTNYPTLYAATSPADDFAESFVTYIHSVMMKKPFELNIKKNGKIIKKFELCWGTPRCRSKENIFKKIFKDLPDN